MGEALILRLINVDIISHHVISDRIRTILAILKKKKRFHKFQGCLHLVSRSSLKNIHFRGNLLWYYQSA